MTILRIQFAGQIKKVEHKTAGGKPLAEVSLCRKHKGRNGAEDSFTWLRVSLWEPADFQVPALVKGGFIAGSGDVQLRSYIAKDNSKGASLECRCTSFDVEVTGGDAGEASAPVAEVPRARPVIVGGGAVIVGAGAGDDEPPFAPIGREYQA